jgi:hypothetical protein
MSTIRAATFSIVPLMLVVACHFGTDTDDDGIPAINRDSPDTSSSTDTSDMDCFDTGPAGLNLGTAAEYAILAKSEIAMIPASTVIGDLGLSPAEGALLTGFTLTMGGTHEYATASEVIGNIYAANYKAPTPTNLTAAVTDMEFAYTEAASLWPDMTGLGAGNIGGMTLSPGVYNWDGNLSIPTDVSLHGCERDVWIFQVGGDLSMNHKANIRLVDGADAKNVFWQVEGMVDIGPAAHLEGILLTRGAVKLHMGASVTGRLLVQSRVDLEGSTVIVPE